MQLHQNKKGKGKNSRLAYENLNVILVIAGLCLSVAVPFILRGFSKRDTKMDKIQEDYDKQYESVNSRLDKYEERLRLAEIEIVRSSNMINRVRNGNNKNGK